MYSYAVDRRFKIDSTQGSAVEAYRARLLEIQFQIAGHGSHTDYKTKKEV